MAINAQELQGQWTKLRGQVKEKWGQLTDDDLQIQGVMLTNSSVGSSKRPAKGGKPSSVTSTS